MAREWLASIGEDTIVVGLEGNLGSGKTTFTQTVARELGVVEQVTSPTFVIQKTYAVTNPVYQGRFKNLVHIDAYRLEQASELEVIGFKKLLSDKGNLIFIEWPERVRELLPENTKIIKFKYIDEGVREISF